MLEQLADQSKEKKLRKLGEFLTHLEDQLKTAEEFKRDNPDREDMNALIELTLAIQEETKAVNDLVKIGEDCPEDWQDLEEAKSSLSRTLDRISHQNWIALGPSSSKRINQLFFHIKTDASSKDTEALIHEVKAVGIQLLSEGLKPELQSRIETLSNSFDSVKVGDFLSTLLVHIEALEDSMDVSLFDGIVNEQETWLSNFTQLAKSAQAGEIKNQVVLAERDLALQRVSDSQNSLASLQEKQNLANDMKALSEHLSELEQSIQGPSSLDDWLTKLSQIWSDLDTQHQFTLSGAKPKCAVCGSELSLGAERCDSCGVAVVSLEQARTPEGQQEAGRSQLLDSLNHSWKLYQCEEIDQTNFLRILKNLSERISEAVESLESPTAVLLDFNTRLELFTQLPDRQSLKNHWPSLLASGRALVNERLSKLERD